MSTNNETCDEVKTKKQYADYLHEGDIYTNDSGQEFVFVRALLRIAKHHAQMIGWDSDVVQAPEKHNLWSATVKVKIYFDHGNGRRFASGVADCRYTTAGDGFQNYTTALAETRAIGRALRRYLDIDLCTFEEQYTPENNAITDTQRNCIEKKFIKSKLFTLTDVSKIIERDVSILTDLSEKEATLVIMKFNKMLKKQHLANCD